MKISRKQKIQIWIQIMVLCLSFWMNAVSVQAAPKQAEIVTTDTQGDLTVLFTFDKEVVDITFISPSGERKTNGDSDVEYAAGELWCTYRIKDAKAGTWKVEYDLGRNSEITYDIVEDESGLWIQYLTVSETESEKVSVAFQADYEPEKIYYNYELYAVSTTDKDSLIELTKGSARSGEEKSIDVKLSGLSGDNYVLRLEVYYDTGTVEVFDTMISDAFDYKNPNEPQAIENFKVKVDAGNLVCHIDWDEYVGWGSDAYQVEAKVAGETVYEADWERDVRTDSILYPADATAMEISLSYKDGNIRSEKKIKTIPLTDESLTIITPEVTNSSQAVLKYSAKKERMLNVNVNGVDGMYQVSGEGEVSFDLMEGMNTIYAEMETDDLITYIVDAEVYCDFIPPEIKLYEDLDGKTFYTDSVAIIGKMSGGNILRIAGETITSDENGDFTYHANLSLGENLIELEAEDVNGNTSKMVLTLYKGSDLVGGVITKIGLAELLPLLVALLVSMIIIIIALVAMKKPDKNSPKKYRTWPFILWDVFVAGAEAVCILQFIVRYRFSNSMKYLELAEKSATKAAQYLKIERFFALASVAGILLLLISVVITILVAKRNKKKRLEMKGEN